MNDDFASVDAYIAGLEDASGIVEAIQAHLAPCPDCGASGYATTYDGRTLGVCSTCNGFGGAVTTPEDPSRAACAACDGSCGIYPYVAVTTPEDKS